MNNRLVVAAYSSLAALALARFIWTVFPEAREGPTVQLIDNASVDELLARRSESVEIAPVRTGDVYPPALIREPLSEADAALLYPALKSWDWVYDPLLYGRPSGDRDRLRKFAEHPEGVFRVRTNSLGMREDQEPRTHAPGLRILVAGDSHTEGVCNNEESFTNQLESMLGRDVEALNAGAGSYNLYNYLGTLERYHDLSPDVFVVTVYGGNDFWGSLFLWRFFERRPEPKREPYSVGRLVDIGHGFTGPIAQELSQVMWLLNNPDDELAAVHLAASISVEIERLAQSMGCRVVFVYLPPPLVTQPQHFADVISSQALVDSGIEEQHLLVSDRMANGWLAFLAANEMNFVDMRTRLRSAEQAYWSTDLHLNVAGHRIVAEALAQSGFFRR